MDSGEPIEVTDEIIRLANDMPQLLVRIAGGERNAPLLDKTTDQGIVHHGTWEQFKFIQKGFEGSPGVRLLYYDGAIEILMPGREHGIFASIIGYLVTTFLTEKGIFFQPTRSMTQQKG